MKDFILDIIHLNNEFTGSGMYLGLYFVTLIFLYFIIKDSKYTKTIVYPSCVLLFGVYICAPFVNNFIAHLYDDEIRGRFCWVFMAPAITAIGCALLVSWVKEVKKQLLLIIVMIPVIFMCGVFQINDYRFNKAENLYKLPQVFIDISNRLLAEERENGDGIARIVVPYETAYVFRQYSTNIEMLYGEDATYGRIWLVEDERRDVCDTMQTSCPDLTLVNSIAKDYDMEYLLLDTVYVDFGLESINVNGYTEDENFVGDRTPSETALAAMSGKITIDEENVCWDLSEFGLEYVDTYGQYLLYRY